MTMRKLLEWRNLCVSPSSSILEVARILQETSTRIVLVVDSDDKLLGIVTDGDIRRGLLAGVSSDESCETVLNSSPRVIGPEGQLDEALRLASGGEAGAIPIVSEDRVLHGVWVTHLSQQGLNNRVIIMAGGKGVRLRPMTSSVPKPLVSLGDKPMLHRLLESLYAEGFREVAISINYLGEQIEESVGDGSSWGLSVTYLREKVALGTAGALGLLEPRPAAPVLVINADVLTGARLGDLLEQHTRHGTAISVGMRVHDIEHPFGVLDLDGSTVTGIREKPIWREFVSAGVYALSPEVFTLISGDEYLDMPDLVSLALSRDLQVEGFPLHEPWLDVGTPEDFRTAQDWVKGTKK
jgi:dTDP-glucose pyrophosphorylase/predicted transcriptional regulator